MTMRNRGVRPPEGNTFAPLSYCSWIHNAPWTSRFPVKGTPLPTGSSKNLEPTTLKLRVNMIVSATIFGHIDIFSLLKAILRHCCSC
ncbi:hypothetical protein ElyMa_004898500 [Elysia marginata]|uniref:Uncharacterized protein n=1 Tax=Elysia marginata TaxID=1093978 RepID=A0AAV4IVB2_9GAST|nr:hypothetical protein ElyMa_004898500 [Elysia marginata]